jgi:hypothetical protein
VRIQLTRMSYATNADVNSSSRKGILLSYLHTHASFESWYIPAIYVHSMPQRTKVRCYGNQELRNIRALIRNCKTFCIGG